MIMTLHYSLVIGARRKFDESNETAVDFTPCHDKKGPTFFCD